MLHRAVIIFDISDDKLRRRLVKLMKYYGVPLQYSAFSFLLKENRYYELKRKVSSFYLANNNVEGLFRICIIPCCNSCNEKSVYYGMTKEDYEMDMVV